MHRLHNQIEADNAHHVSGAKDGSKQLKWLFNSTAT
jgi:hypothetical protein